jgi:hypothetical protein
MVSAIRWRHAGADEMEDVMKKSMKDGMNQDGKDTIVFMAICMGAVLLVLLLCDAAAAQGNTGLFNFNWY